LALGIDPDVSVPAVTLPPPAEETGPQHGLGVPPVVYVKGCPLVGVNVVQRGTVLIPLTVMFSPVPPGVFVTSPASWGIQVTLILPPVPVTGIVLTPQIF